MALRRTDENVNESLSGMKAKQVFSNKEKKVLTTFSIEPSFKAELEELFSDMGLGWAAGVRFALRVHCLSADLHFHLILECYQCICLARKSLSMAA